MPYFTDATDDVLSVAVTPSFDGGQVSGISPNLIADNAASELLNMTISPNGNLQTRQGIETVSTSFSTSNTIQGMFYFDTPNIETIVVGTNGTLYKYNTGSTIFSTTGGTVVNSSAQIEFAQLNNKLFFTDGTSNLQFTNGTSSYRQGTSILSITVSTQGLGYTGSTAAVTIGAPNLAYGTTASAIATVTGGTVSGVIVTNAGSGYTSAPSVTIAAPPAGGGHFTATATASISSLAPAGLRLIKSFTNRLFAVGTGEDRNTLYASDILDPEIWKTTNSIIVGGDDGEDIIAIQPFYGFQIIVFKRNKIYLVDVTPSTTTTSGTSVLSLTNSAAEWTVQTVSNRIGCIAGRSVALVNKDVFFLANDGIRSVSRSLADDFSTVGLTISEPVKDIIARINRSFISTCNATFHNNRYLLAIPLDSATNPSHILVYNSIFNCFEGLWEIAAARMVETSFTSGFTTNTIKLCIGTTNSRVGHLTDYKDSDSVDINTGFQDFGTGYTSRVVTKAYEFDDRFALKYGSHYEVEFFNSGSTNATISMRRDTDGNDIILGTNVDTTSPDGLTLPFTLPATLSAKVVKRRADSLRSYEKWRNIKMKVEAASRKLSIRGVIMAANPDTIQIQQNT
jgi:hypothetical protein